MKKFLLLLLISLILNACKSESNSNSNSKEPSISLICQAEKSKMQDIPAHSVHLMMDGKKIKLANILACETFTKTDYKNYEMPKTTIDACGGWWAGAGEYFYLNKNSDNSYGVYYGQMYEEKETKKYDYTELVRIKKDANEKYIAHPKHQLHDLVGIYTLGGHDTSWLLEVKPKGDQIEATYYTIDGMLPPPDYYKKNKLENGQVLKNFDVDFSDMVIESDLGTGQLEVIFGRERITFFDIKSHQEDMLRLTKDAAMGN